MSAVTHKSFSITPAGMFAKDWDGVTDTNNDGKLSFKEDGWKDFEIKPSGIYFYNRDGTTNVSVTVDGTTLH